ncbi:MAG: hypothetical protein ACE5HB_08665 [Terriglobia bacterium]
MAWMNNLAVDVVGWAGAALLLVAYGLVSARKVTGASAGYQWLNLVGSILLMVNTAFYGAYPSAFVNVVWLVIAVWALRKILGGAAAEES